MRSLHHFVAKSEWSDTAVMARVRDWVLPTLGLESGRYWIIDDTGFPKKEKHSVGVARQYCGQQGKQGNCQVAISLPAGQLTGQHSHRLPATGYQLYLPKDWAYPQITFLAAAGRTRRHVLVAISTLRASSRK